MFKMATTFFDVSRSDLSEKRKIPCFTNRFVNFFWYFWKVLYFFYTFYIKLL